MTFRAHACRMLALLATLVHVCVLSLGQSTYGVRGRDSMSAYFAILECEILDGGRGGGVGGRRREEESQ